jgi:hypothetical protein
MITDEAWELLRADASDIAAIAAQGVMEATGFKIDPREDAPDTYPDLRAAHDKAVWNADTAWEFPLLPIYNGHTDKTIYTSPEANIMARFWHDMTHLELNRDFSRSGETAVAVSQYHVAIGTGQMLGIPFGRVAQAALLIYRDTVAQVAYGERFGGFPDDQETYMRDVWDYGTTVAMNRASERVAA